MLSSSWGLVAAAVVAALGFVYTWKTMRNHEAIVERQPAPRYEPRKIDYTRAGLLAEMETTRNRPVEKLPISVDLPRLARKTIIQEGDRVLLDGTSPEFDSVEPEIRARLIAEVWASLSQLVGEESAIYSDLTERLQGGEIDTLLGAWLKTNFSTSTKVIRVLKVCNQSILASAVVRMKEAIGTDWPYKDQRGQWIIVVRRDGEKVTVTHTKKEVSWESTKLHDEQHFEFTWSLRMAFDENVEQMTGVSVTIDELVFVPTVTEATRKEIAATINECEIVEPFALSL